MNKTIYILSEYFAPFQNIGSIKFSKIAKYLSEEQENQIFVFTRKWWKSNDVFLENDLSFMRKNGVKIFYINEGYIYSSKNRKIITLFQILAKKIYGIEKYCYDINQRTSKIFVKKAWNIIRKEHIPTPNLILSTYDDWGGHYLGNELKLQFPDSVWIADFRDPIISFIKDGKYRRLCDEYSLMVSKNADYITSVSKGCLDSIKKYPSSKSMVITNGFDYSDYTFLKDTIIDDEVSQKDKIVFTYTGSFYNNSLLPFFTAIRELCEEGRISKEKIEINYAGTNNERIFSEIRSVGLESIYVNNGILSRYDAIKLQHKSDILLTAVWNTKESQGIIGGKILGYLMLKKPILAIVMGDVPNSEIKKIMTDINCGYAYEEANHSNDYKILKDVIWNFYKQKIANKTIEIAYNDKELERYDLKNIALSYEKLYYNIINERK